ncbi:MAG: hypothetical protein C5S44_11390 [Candidatus Methanocomedens sp.]|nr:MAG: hypothetical protein C5S44_11390 [ANME-2 cluster archaeon]
MLKFRSRLNPMSQHDRTAGTGKVRTGVWGGASWLEEYLCEENEA